jgi:hypothetical protein
MVNRWPHTGRADTLRGGPIRSRGWGLSHMVAGSIAR